MTPFSKREAIRLKDMVVGVPRTRRHGFGWIFDLGHFLHQWLIQLRIGEEFWKLKFYHSWAHETELFIRSQSAWGRLPTPTRRCWVIAGFGRRRAVRSTSAKCRHNPEMCCTTPAWNTLISRLIAILNSVKKSLRVSISSLFVMSLNHNEIIQRLQQWGACDVSLLQALRLTCVTTKRLTLHATGRRWPLKAQLSKWRLS